jgi:hypothetical protein
MLRAFSTAATGMSAQQKMVDTIANNLANINTNGYKRRQAVFEDLLYVKLKQAGREVSSGVIAPAEVEIGSGVRFAATSKVFTPGELETPVSLKTWRYWAMVFLRLCFPEVSPDIRVTELSLKMPTENWSQLLVIPLNLQ